MNTIEIATAHNIIFRYELASVVQRGLAFSTDIFILFIYAMVIGAVVGGNSILAYILIGPVIGFYHFLFEVYNYGQSPGKMLLKIRVIALNGQAIKPYDFFMRWIFRMVDILFSFGSLAIIFISSSEKNQRVGDILAQTAVISLQNDLSITIDSIQKSLRELEEILYPKIVAYNDSDMMLVKQVIIRNQLHPNAANVKVMRTLCEKICKELDLVIPTKGHLKFLKTLLNEYIVLTR